MSDRTIGFVGIGNMGGRIARRLHQASWKVIGYDTDPSRATSWGLTSADSLRELVVASDCILLSLPDSSVVESVTRGDGGILATGRPGQVVFDLTSADPASTVQLHRELAARDIAFLDAAISGGAPAADAGTLTIMVGGDWTTVQPWQSVLEVFGSDILWMGEVGAGHTTKVLNNFLNAVSLTATAEVMVAAERAGLDLERFLSALNRSSGQNYATTTRFPRLLEGDYREGGGTTRIAVKDVHMYIERLRELGVPSLNAAGCLATFALAEHLGYGDRVSSRVVDAIGDMAGGVRLHGSEPHIKS